MRQWQKIAPLLGVALYLAGCGNPKNTQSATDWVQGQATVQFNGSNSRSVSYGSNSPNTKMFCDRHNGTFEIIMTENEHLDTQLGQTTFDSKIVLDYLNNLDPTGRIDMRSDNTVLEVYKGKSYTRQPVSFAPSQIGSCYTDAQMVGDQLSGRFVCVNMHDASGINVLTVDASFNCPIVNW